MVFRDVFPDWPEEDIPDLFSVAEVDANGYMNYEQFANWLWSLDEAATQTSAADSEEGRKAQGAEGGHEAFTSDLGLHRRPLVG